MGLVKFLDALKYLIGFFHTRFVDVDPLKPPSKRPVAVECGLVLGMGRGTDTTQIAGRKCRFKDVRSIHRTARNRSGTDNCMDLVDKQYRVFLFLDLVYDRLKPLLKIAAVACSGQHRAHIESKNLGPLQNFRDIAFADLERKTLG